MIPIAPVAFVVLLSLPALAATIHVPADQPTILAGVRATLPGDTVEVACGTYAESTIHLKANVLIRSATGEPDCVVVDGQSTAGVFYTISGPASLEGLTITGGSAPSGGGLNASEDVSVTRCRFLGNVATFHGGAILAAPGMGAPPTVTMVECEFSGNEAGGGGGAVAALAGTILTTGCSFTANRATDGGAIRAENGGLSALVSVRGSVFSGNTAAVDGGAISTVSTDLFCFGTTMVGNGAGGRGAGIAATQRALHVETTLIVSSSSGEAVYQVGNGPPPVVRCVDAYGNAGGDWVGALAGRLGIDGNFSADPLFCDSDNGNFYLQWGSPCLPANSGGCLLVGALGAGGCNSVAVTQESWARVKARYR